MGASLSWVVRIGASRDETLALMGLSPSGKRALLASQALQGLALPDGNYLVVARGCEHEIVSDRSLAALSTRSDVIACSLEEHVMCCDCSFWRHGRRLWRVEHDGQQSMRHLESEGELPAAFNDIRNRAEREQDAEDADAHEVDFFFEVPLQLARSLVGFKHDEPAAGIDLGAFETLVPAGEGIGNVRKWWQVWR